MANLNLNLNVKRKIIESVMEYKAPFMAYHQNIRSLYGTTDGLLRYSSNEYPHVPCITEHHPHVQEISKLCSSTYILAAKYCRNKLKLGGVCIYVYKSLSFTMTDIEKYCKEQNFEVCAIKLCLASTTYCIISIYRAPIGNFFFFTLLQTL
jgi:hypothetical protein